MESINWWFWRGITKPFSKPLGPEASALRPVYGIDRRSIWKENEIAGAEREETALTAQRILGPLRYGVARLILGCWLAVVASSSILFGAGAQQEQTAPAAGLAGTDTASGASAQADDPDIQEIIRRFAAKEKEFQIARENYTYRQIVKVQELSPDGEVRGTFHVEEDIMFTQDGKRFEKVAYAPLSTLRAISISPEDERDLRSVQPFVLTTDDLHKYDVKYMGRQNVDELSTYVFMVSPKRMERASGIFRDRSGWMTAICKSSRPTERRSRISAKKARKTFSPGLRLTGNRSTASTGSRHGPARMTPCISAEALSGFA